MLQHLRANLWLLFLTLLLCSVLYPLTLWGIGQTIFHRQAQGSLLTNKDQQPVGSSLIAQSFNGDEFFQPRPSATSPSYNAMASGGSNVAANNPKLRGRVAQQLGPMVRYASPEGPGKGRLVGEDVEQWFQSENDPKKPLHAWGNKPRRDLTAEWASGNSSLVPVWATSSDLVSDYVTQWAKNHPAILDAWKTKNPTNSGDPKPEDLAPFLFDPAIAGSFVSVHPGMWPCTVEEEKDGKKVKLVKPDNKGDDVRSIFFDMWLQEHPGAAKMLEPVPADMVMTSGSGLDPHITLKNALYQLDRVATAWADKTKRDPDEVRATIRDLLKEKAAAPLGGLVGVPLINVLEVNLLLSERMK
jgi:potassium-transporting ATPase KdpC subunit